jgi:hypothetical protein
LNQERERQWANSGRVRDWTNAGVVALVLSVAVVIAAITIAVFDNSAVVASRGTGTSEPTTTGQGGGAPETSGSAR